MWRQWGGYLAYIDEYQVAADPFTHISCSLAQPLWPNPETYQEHRLEAIFFLGGKIFPKPGQGITVQVGDKTRKNFPSEGGKDHEFEATFIKGNDSLYIGIVGVL